MTEKPLPRAIEPTLGSTAPNALEAASIIVEPSESVSHTTDGDTTSAPAQRTFPKEIGGRDGPEPTRFGDWEKGGRCIDF
jgi:hypothetical protein